MLCRISYVFFCSTFVIFPPPSFIRIQQRVYVLCFFLFELHELPPSKLHPHTTNSLCPMCFPFRIAWASPLHVSSACNKSFMSARSLRMLWRQFSFRNFIPGWVEESWVCWDKAISVTTDGAHFIPGWVEESDVCWGKAISVTKNEFISSLGGLRKVDFVGIRLFRPQTIELISFEVLSTQLRMEPKG